MLQALHNLLGEVRSYFPPYYRGIAWAVLAASAIGIVTLQFFRDAEPSWAIFAVALPIYFVTSHAAAFVVNFLRARFSQTSPGDVAKPVAYYTPDMPAAAYQPTFLRQSTLVKLGILAVLVSTASAFITLGQTHFAPSWRAINLLLRAIVGAGFAFGCWEIDRAIKTEATAGRGASPTTGLAPTAD
jgi:hypothetical protein